MRTPDALVGGRASSPWRQQQLVKHDTEHLIVKAHRVVISLLSLTCGALLVVCNHLARPSSTSCEADAALMFLLLVAVSYLSYEFTWPRARAVAAAGLAGTAAWHPAATYNIVYQAAAWGSDHSASCRPRLLLRITPLLPLGAVGTVQAACRQNKEGVCSAMPPMCSPKPQQACTARSCLV